MAAAPVPLWRSVGRAARFLVYNCNHKQETPDARYLPDKETHQDASSVVRLHDGPPLWLARSGAEPESKVNVYLHVICKQEMHLLN